jgi:CheY-like chemotaxis protein
VLSEIDVLIVEKSPALRRFLEGVLRQQLNGRRIVETASGEAARNLLSQPENGFGLVILGLETPDIDLTLFLSWLKGSETVAELPLLVLAATPRPPELGAEEVEWLVAPFPAAGLIQKISAAVAAADRRAMTRRKSAALKGTLVFAGRQRYKGTLIDLSQTGTLLRTPPLTHGTRGVFEPVEVEFPFGEGGMSIKGEVVRLQADMRGDSPTRDHILIGVQFTSIDEATGAKLRALIDEMADDDRILSPSRATGAGEDRGDDGAGSSLAPPA